MITIVSGTNREKSNSLKVSRTCEKLLEKHGEAVQVCCLSQLPENFFSVMYEKEYPGYAHFIEKYITKADRIVFVIPEYQGSYPGALKSFMDAIDPKLISDKKACLIGIASGRGGGIRPQSHFTDVLHHLEVEVFSRQPKFSGIHKLVDHESMVDQTSIALLEDLFTKFLKF
tara:strand:- start:857 stop:1372 length:516 start_codon:yes stop_codon:yes gene_type:complete